MKSAIDLWNSPNEGATNSSGFSGFPGGFRNAIGDFLLIGDAGHWWSSTELSSYIARFRGLNYYNGYVVDNGGYNVNGFSVRCLRD